MGLACSDAKKRSRSIPTIARFCSSYTETSDSCCSVSFYTTENKDRGFECKKRTRIRRVNSWSHLNTRYVDNEMRPCETVTISELKITRRSVSEKIRFRKKKDRVVDKTDHSYHDGELGWSPIKTMRSDNISVVSRRISMSNSREETPETSVISRSPRSPQEGNKAKNYGAQTTQGTNESVFSVGMSAKIRPSEILALGKSRSLPILGEPTTQMVKDERDKILSDYISSLFSELKNDKHHQQKQSSISGDTTILPEPPASSDWEENAEIIILRTSD